MKTVLNLVLFILLSSGALLFAQIDIDNYRADNASSPLSIPAYQKNLLGQDEILHPDVLYFNSGWHGYKYWMAFTPFPDANPEFENPSIAVSNDNVTWTVPSPLNNPIDTFPGAGYNVYNSDPELVMAPDDSLLCIWRRSTASLETLFYRSSSDGTNWSAERTTLMARSPNVETLISPSIIYHDGYYRMWTVKKAVSPDLYRKIIFRKATTLMGLKDATPIVTSNIGNRTVNDGTFYYRDTNSPQGFITYETWHINVIFHNGYYWMINTVGPLNESKGGDIFLAYSVDGIDWTFGSLPILRRRDPADNWDRILYRGSILPLNSNSNHFQIWYSVQRKNENTTKCARIGYTYTTGVLPANTAVNVSGYTIQATQTLQYHENVTIAELPSLPGGINLVNPNIIKLTATNLSTDITVFVASGTVRCLIYYGGTWHQGYPYLLNAPGFTTFSNVPFGAKGSAYLLIGSEEATLPVELSSFTAILTEANTINLQWTSQSETNLSGYYVFRNSFNILPSAVRASPFFPATNTSLAAYYSFTDSEIEPGTWHYWLQSLDFNSESSFHGPVSVNLSDYGANVPPPIPVLTSIKRIYPNPFSSSTTISFELSKASNVSLTLYDLKGKKLYTLQEGNLDSGTYHKIWNGNDEKGINLSSGIYLLKMTAGSFTELQKLVMVK